MTRVPHPFPYQGSKRNLAPVIAQYLPDTISCFLEPFAGAAAVSLYLAAHRKADKYIICDLNEPLIELWKAIFDSSYALSEKYQFLWQEQLNDEETYYDFIRNSFNQEHKPEQFLYLLARCVKAAVRYNNQGYFNQSRDKRRLGMHPDRMRENLTSVASLLYGRANFYSQDYRETLEMATIDDVIYMDPPYQGTSGNRDKRYIDGLVVAQDRMET